MGRFSSHDEGRLARMVQENIRAIHEGVSISCDTVVHERVGRTPANRS